MKTGVRVFLNSAIFGVAIALVYWFCSRDPGGTILLAFMGAAMCFAAGFVFFAERNARLSGDQKKPDARSVRDDLECLRPIRFGRWPPPWASSSF